MSVETGSVIAALDNTKPLSGDSITEGDNHLRLIKSILKTQFPGASGLGYNIPINATEAELNYLVGATSNIQAQINALTGAPVSGNLIAPAGTVMTFYQLAPPFGWAQVNTHANAMLRVVSGAGGGSGGTDSPVTVSLDHTHSTSSHTLTFGEMPSHSHRLWGLTAQHGADNDAIAYPGTPIAGETEAVDRGYRGSNSADNLVEMTGGSAGHSHGETASVSLSHSPKYIDMILASKD
jgi:hypothetical protein